MLTVLRTAALLLLFLTVLPQCFYLLILTVAAPFGLRRVKTGITRLRRIAVLVPAHNEERVLGRLLESLRALDYPKQFFDIYVVADNCTDATATIARADGAIVLERFDTDRRSKGHALAWLLDQLEAQQRIYEAYIIVDADSVLSQTFLTAMNRRLQAGTLLAQGYYTVLKVEGGPTESLREIALALVHFLRPAAKMALGASCGLKGNGMCFDRSVLKRFGWPTAGLAEDVEFHLSLVASGLRVVFVPEATVRAEMPSSLKRAQSQNLRWEAGRLAAVRGQVLPLLVDGLRRRSILRIDAALEQLIPPLSIPVLLAALLLVGGLALHAPVISVGAAAALIVLAAYVTTGLLLARVPFATWFALMGVPRYILWKGLLYLRAVAAPPKQLWLRTPHGQQSTEPRSGQSRP